MTSGSTIPRPFGPGWRPKAYHNRYRGHMTLGGAVPEVIRRGDHWQRPALCAKRVSASIERRFFLDTRTTAYRLPA